MTEMYGCPKGHSAKATFSAYEPMPESASEETSTHGAQLPPVDGGFHAWMFLAASFVIEGLVWGIFRVSDQLLGITLTLYCPGYSFSFGVFQEHYQSHEPFKGSTNIAIVGTCATVSLQSNLYAGRPSNIRRVSRIS